MKKDAILIESYAGVLLAREIEREEDASSLTPRRCHHTDRRASEEIFAVDLGCFLFLELDETDGTYLH